MAGKSGITVLILVIAAFAAAGCSFPVGNIGGSPPRSGAYDGLLVEYTRSSYNVGQSFLPGHLQAFTTDRSGVKQPLSAGAYSIVVIENPARPAVVSPPVTASGYQFTTAGEKAIQVRYNNLQVQYRIDVLPSGSETSQTSGIVIVWP